MFGDFGKIVFGDFMEITYWSSLRSSLELGDRKWRLNHNGEIMETNYGDQNLIHHGVENVPQRELGDHDDLVVLKVMAELARCDQNGVEQLLNLRVMSFGLINNLTDEVYRMLNLIGVPGLLAFDDDSCANDVRSGGDVDQ